MDNYYLHDKTSYIYISHRLLHTEDFASASWELKYFNSFFK